MSKPTQGMKVALAAVGIWLSLWGFVQATEFPPTVIKLGMVGSTEQTQYQGPLKFAELVSERTGGAVDVQIFPGGQLGNEKDLVEQVKLGIIQMSLPSAGVLAAFQGWEPVGVFGMPYIFEGDTDEEVFPVFLQLARGPIIGETAEKAAATSGIRALDLGWWLGTRQLTTSSRQVQTVDDLQGLKIRTPDAPVQKLAMTALGAAVTPMAFSELYTALQMGVVDGQENPFDTIYAQKFYEVQKYLSLTGHMTMNFGLVINEGFYQSLSPELRDILVQAAHDAGDHLNQLQVQANNDRLALLKEQGMIVTEVDRAAFAEKTKDAWKEFEAGFGPGLYEEIRKAQGL